MIDETTTKLEIVITKLEIFYKIATILQDAEKEIEFCDKLDSAVIKRVAYDRIVKILKENSYAQT